MFRLFLMSASRFQPNSVLIHLSPGERQSLPTKGMAIIGLSCAERVWLYRLSLLIVCGVIRSARVLKVNKLHHNQMFGRSF